MTDVSKCLILGNKKPSHISSVFFQILWKSRCFILLIFPSHLKKLRPKLQFWWEKLNFGFFHTCNMLEQPQTGLISRFFRQVKNRLKNVSIDGSGAPSGVYLTLQTYDEIWISYPGVDWYIFCVILVFTPLENLLLFLTNLFYQRFYFEFCFCLIFDDAESC